MKRKIFAMILAITITAGEISIAVWADEANNGDVSVEVSDEAESIVEDSDVIVESGQCGENVTYTLDAAGTLVISGSGDMWDYSFYSKYPPFKDFSVKDIMIGDDITSIGDYTFFGCEELTDITIPEGVNSIGIAAFSGCNELSSISIPASVINIGDSFDVFNSCGGLLDIEVNANNKNYSSESGVLFDKEKEQILRYPEGKAGSYQIPKGVKSIGSSAFFGCRSLTDVEIPEGVKTIGFQAFRECIGLTNINFPNSLTTIEEYAFEDCSELNSVKFPEGLNTIGLYAFSNCSGLTSVKIPKGVVSIGDGAFEGCSGLTGIEVDVYNQYYSSKEGVLFDAAKESILHFPARKIGGYQISEGVRSIGNYAFMDCSGLTDVTIPESVDNIGDYAFSGCSSLTNIEVDENNQNYCSKEGVLFDKTKEKLLRYPAGRTGWYQVPEGVKEIGIMAFRGSALTHVDMPKGLENINLYAFSGCGGLTGVNVPESVNNIGDNAFYGCSALTHVKIPIGVDSIGLFAFNDCSNLTIYCQKDSYAHEYAVGWDIPVEFIEEAVVEVGSCGKEAVYYLDSEGTLTISGSGEIRDYSRNAQNFIFQYDRQSPFQNRPIKKVVIENGISHIGSDAFYGCKELMSVIIQEGVISIGSAAFEGCSGLADIIMPESVTSIGLSAFSGCSSLTNIMIPKSVTNISKGAFSNCGKLLAIDVEEDNENYCSIDGVLFDKGGERILQYPSGKSGTYQIPESVTTIGECAFDGSIGLTGITIPKGVIQIESLDPMPIGVGSGVFSDCSRLIAIDVAEDNANYCSVDGVLFDKEKKQILSFPGARTGTYEIPDGVTSIWYDAFKGCSGLTGIPIPEGVQRVESGAFSDCSGLTSITLPEGTGIGPNVFSGCSNLASITIPKGITSIQAEAFADCEGLTSITVPEGVMSIGSDVFFGCSNLTSVILPEGITDIGYGAFFGCSSLTSITLPQSLIYIGIQAFDECDELTIYCQKDSYAHMYAMQEGIPFQFVEQLPTENPQTYTIFFDANGGTDLSQNNRAVTEGNVLGELPSVTRSGHTLTGWYTAKTGGTAVTKDTVITSNLTLYAQWKANQNIASENQSIANAEITLSHTSYSYDGSEKKPAVKSVKLGNTMLISGTDYTVEYQNNKNIGTATVVITGKGNYIGTAAKTFIIRAKTGAIITSGAYKYKIIGSAEAAFAGLKSSMTKKVTIPKAINIGGKTFKVTSINAKALQNTKVTSVAIGANVKTIGSSAFAGCSKLSKVTIASNVTKIGSNAFKNCTVLESVTVPSKMTAIGTGAFSGCKKLAMITVKSTKLKTVGKNAFKGIKPTAKIKVPSKKFTAYQKLLKSKGQGKSVKIVK